MQKTNQNLESQESALLGRITAHNVAFLRFLTLRVADVGTAEDILQSAYVKAMEHGSDIRDEESTVAWFYRILRHAIVDHYRRRGARKQAHEMFAAGTPAVYESEMEATVCACIGAVIQDLKSEYREAIQQVDLEGKNRSGLRRRARNFCQQRFRSPPSRKERTR